MKHPAIMALCHTVTLFIPCRFVAPMHALGLLYVPDMSLYQ